MALSISKKLGYSSRPKLDLKECQILEYLINFRNPYKPLNESALDFLNNQHFSIDVMDWVLTIEKLRGEGYIERVDVQRNRNDIPHDYVQFSPESYISYEGIKYLKESDWSEQDDKERQILNVLLRYRNPDSPIDDIGLSELNNPNLSMDEVDRAYIVNKLSKSGYIKM